MIVEPVRDIYLPMSVARLDGQGGVENPCVIEFLTVDDSYGRMPSKVPNEVIPHMQNAIDDAPDQPGPLVWVFPFDQYHQQAFGEAKNLSLPFFGDWFIRGTINAGLPLNTVISDRNFISADKALLEGSTLVALLPEEGSQIVESYLEFIQSGGNIIFYGPAASADNRILELLGIDNQNSAISGEFGVQLDDICKSYDGVKFPTKVNHRSNISAGGCCVTCSGAHVIAVYSDGTNQRAAALPETNRQESVRFRRPQWLYLDEEIIPHENVMLPGAFSAKVENISGDLMISW